MKSIKASIPALLALLAIGLILNLNSIRGVSGLGVKEAWALATATPTATATPGYINPAAVTPGTYTAVSAMAAPFSVGTGVKAPLTNHRLEIQNNCSAIVTIQFNGVAASTFGYGFEIPATSTKVWSSVDGPVPQGPYSLITSSALCDPNAGTGLSIFEGP